MPTRAAIPLRQRLGWLAYLLLTSDVNAVLDATRETRMDANLTKDMLQDDLVWAREQNRDLKFQMVELRAENARLRERLSWVERCLQLKQKQPTVFVFHH